MAARGEQFKLHGEFRSPAKTMGPRALRTSSFYPYFPSKRDLLYSLGTDTYAALDTTLDEMRALEVDWSPDDAYEIIRIYLRFLEQHGAFMLVWSQATYGDEALAKAGVRTRLANARRFGQILQRLSGEEPDPDDDPARFGLAILVMIDRY